MTFDVHIEEMQKKVIGILIFFKVNIPLTTRIHIQTLALSIVRGEFLSLF